MRRNDHMARRFLAVFLASVLAYGNFGIQVALGVEAAGGSVDVTEKLAETQPAEDQQSEEPATEDEPAAEPQPEAATQATDNANDPTPVAATTNDDTTTDSDADPAAETLPYSIEVTFGDQELAEGEGQNNFTSADYWTSSQDAKLMTVVLKRNSSVPVDAGKKYVLSLSVPTFLYFGGMPAAESITGVKAVAMKKNAAPSFNTRYGKTEAYPLSSFSGEMRFELNTSVDQITVEGIGVRFDPVLLGYKTNGSTLQNPVVAKVDEVNADKALDGYDEDDAHEVVNRKVDALTIRNTLASDGNIAFYSSNNGFETSIVNAGNSASSEGNLSYALSTSSFTDQVFGSLTIVFHCPYIEVNGQRRYLEFDRNSSVLSTNKPVRSGTTAGWKLDSSASYSEADHTITYHFKDARIERYALFAYTPTFTLPDDLKATVPDGNGYVVKSDGWQVLEQTNYNGDTTTSMKTSQRIGSNYFKRDGSNIRLLASFDGSDIATRNIYKGITPDSGATATLGLYDLHNTGVSDSPEVRIDFDFNTEGDTGATYYVTRVNLPLYGMGNTVDVSYQLTNGVSGVKTVNAANVIAFTRDSLGYSGDVYLQHVSYVTKLRNNTAYHQEVTHGGRNRAAEPCVFLGQMTGEVGETAKATMTVSSVDGETPITTDGKTQVSATEVSTISEDNATGFGLNRPTIGSTASSMGGSALITAGDTANLAVSFAIQSEEFPTPSLRASIGYSVNGYHVVENPVVYVCLPDGVSISGKSQASGNVSGKPVSVSDVSSIDGSECDVNGVSAKWWRVEYDGANVGIGGTTFNANLQFSTDLTMQSLVWDFSGKLVVRSKGQEVTWNCASQYSPYQANTLDELRTRGNSLNASTLNALANGLASVDGANTKMGMLLYTVTSGTMLNISRAEAKLDVSTSLSLDQGAGGQQSLRVTSATSDINYDVKVASNDGGYANNFNYYIPVPKVSSGTDANMFVSKKDFSLEMDHEVDIASTDSTGKAVSAGDSFKVQYTVEEGLTSESVRSDSVVWTDSADDLSAVTAVRISTTEDAVIDNGSSYDFHLTFRYSGNDFGAQAGRSVQWRSFGHYTYQRGAGAATTNSYPSQNNSVKLGYVADLTASDLFNVAINTGDAANVVSLNRDLDQTFVNPQTMKIKNVTVSNGTTLVSEDPAAKTGAEANSQFMMQFGINSNTTGMATLANEYSGGSYNVASGSPMTLAVKTLFSKALTDNSTPRNVVVQFGNDDVDIKVQINLIRTVAPAEVTGSGTAEGEQFAAAKVNRNQIDVAANAAFTALYHITNFIPGNFTAQKLVWKDANDAAATLPTGTNITMLVLGPGSDNSIKSWWLYTAEGTESSVDLSKFKRMGGSDNFTYDTSGPAGVELKYQFVVSFPENCATEGSFKIGFAADAKAGVTASVTDDLPVNLVSRASFGLSVDGQKVSYTYTPAESEASDSRTSGKLLALVLAPQSGGDELPADAKVTAGGASYAKNDNGNFIVPLNTASTGSVDLGLTSEMAPTTGGSYGFDVSLMLYSATAASENEGAAPQAGLSVRTGSVKLGIEASTSPSLKVTGKRVATNAEWINGCDFTFEVKNLPEGASLTVDAYSGLTGNIGQRVTDLMSSVVGDGSFEINDGTATYKGASSSGARTGKLTLSSTAAVGTYRLVFKVADAAGNEIMSVPYYIVVRE